MNFDPLNDDLRAVDTQWSISALRKFLEIMEAQLEEVHRCERVVLEGERPTSGDEEDHNLFSNQQNAMEELFEQDLTPAMRYSFIVLMHIVFETRLRAFCADMERDRKISISLGELRGSSIDKACTYLTKLAALPVVGFPEWQHLRTLQTVRDCIVHAYGYVSESRDKKEMRGLASQNIGVTIDASGRLVVDKAFCDRSLACLDTFFDSLFRSAGWTP